MRFRRKNGIFPELNAVEMTTIRGYARVLCNLICVNIFLKCNKIKRTIGVRSCG